MIGRHLYSNGVRVQRADTAEKRGQSFLAGSLWVSQRSDVVPEIAAGEAMFRGQCASCHTRDGYRPMKDLLTERNREAIGNFLGILHDYSTNSTYRAYMPPLIGTTNEIRALGDYLAALNSIKRAAAATETGAAVLVKSAAAKIH